MALTIPNNVSWDIVSSEEVVVDDAGPKNMIVFSKWRTSPPAENQAIFCALATEWKNATGGLPRVIDKIRHPAYRRIISWGMDAVPHILNDISSSEEPAHWFEALHEITGANPVDDRETGNLTKMAEAWIRWGKKRNLIE